MPRVAALDVLHVDNADLDPLSGDLPRLDLGVFVSADFPGFPRTLETPLLVPRVFAPFSIFCSEGVTPVAFPFCPAGVSPAVFAVVVFTVAALFVAGFVGRLQAAAPRLTRW